MYRKLRNGRIFRKIRKTAHQGHYVPAGVVQVANPGIGKTQAQQGVGNMGGADIGIHGLIGR